VLVTAGPTQEPLDPVRYLTNRSSGRMGFAVAAAARALGAEVTLIAGPTNEPTPAGVRRIDVDTAAAMHDAVMAQRPTVDILIAAAAVCDYRASEPANEKIKKQGEHTSLALSQNPDILADAAIRDGNRPPLVVGFAAETQDLIANARDKLQRKGADLIAANWVGRADTGFDSSVNALELVAAENTVSLASAPKPRLARQLMDHISERYHAATANPSP
jgi:phosphopantothenoylcysteine decarboxylase/phosphopantothenate--cysteine ligase